jgi:hypothetical protein
MRLSTSTSTLSIDGMGTESVLVLMSGLFSDEDTKYVILRGFRMWLRKELSESEYRLMKDLLKLRDGVSPATGKVILSYQEKVLFD